jgi:hypothetical protein
MTATKWERQRREWLAEPRRLRKRRATPEPGFVERCDAKFERKYRGMGDVVVFMNQSVVESGVAQPR